MKIPLVLLIDDEAVVAQSCKMLLKAGGFDVLVATSVAAAIEAWNVHQADIQIVLTDWAIDHQTNGEQLVERFRADRPNLKSILYSAHPLQQLLSNRVEGVDYLQKPVAGKDLIAAVRRALQG